MRNRHITPSCSSPLEVAGLEWGRSVPVAPGCEGFRSRCIIRLALHRTVSKIPLCSSQWRFGVVDDGSPACGSGAFRFLWLLLLLLLLEVVLSSISIC